MDRRYLGLAAVMIGLTTFSLACFLGMTCLIVSELRSETYLEVLTTYNEEVRALERWENEERATAASAPWAADEQAVQVSVNRDERLYKQSMENMVAAKQKHKKDLEDYDVLIKTQIAIVKKAREKLNQMRPK